MALDVGTFLRAKTSGNFGVEFGHANDDLTLFVCDGCLAISHSI